MNFLDFIHAVGYWGVFSIVFAETGLLFGVFLPGDTMLFAAGVMAKQGAFNIWILMAGCFVMGFIGNLLAYWLGARYGLPFARKYAAKLITEDHIQKTHDLFKKYGSIGILIARFVQILRTVAPFLAGVVQMDKRHFFWYSLIGAALWGAGIPWVGYKVGHAIPEEYINMLLIPVALIMLYAVVKGYLAHQKQTKNSNNS